MHDIATSALARESPMFIAIELLPIKSGRVNAN